MRKIIISIVTISVAIVAFATTKVWVYEKDGNRTSFEYDQLDSITHVTPGTIALSLSEKKMPFEGGVFDIDVMASQPWTATISNPDMVQISQQSGNGNSTIKVTVNANRLYELKTVSVKFRIADGTVNTLLINWQDRISITPNYVTLTPKDNSFLVNVTCNTSWTASCDAEWLTLSEYSGSGDSSVNVEVQANPILTQDNFATLTFKTLDGEISSVFVTRDGEKVSVSPASKTLPPAGGTYKIGVTSNTDWTVNANESWVTFDRTNGALNDSIRVIVAKSDKVESTSATITITTSNGKTTQCSVIREGDKISINPTTKEIRYEGGTIDMVVTSNTDWTASSNKSWATLSVFSGSENGTIIVTVSENTSFKADTAVVTFTTAVGKTASTSIIRLGIEKCNASDYPQVTIGTQVWMAENYRCSKYDTQSEAYKEGRYTIPTSERGTYTPYFADASDKNKWSIRFDEYDSKETGKNLTDAQTAKLGYLYNWAAAVGIGDVSTQTTAFTSNCQGICPNGWHVPTDDEWQTLQDYIEKSQDKGSKTAGKHLKTTSGWYDYGYPQINIQGLDSYGFAALPAGTALGSSVCDVGQFATFWTATTSENESIFCAYQRILDADDDISEYHGRDLFGKSSGLSVRCLKD